MSDQRILASSAVMAAGTVVSRASGFVRAALLVAALGALLHADLFTIANTLPNMLYILLAGGVFNAVLVPQLVRPIKDDPDGGEAYTNRVITLAGAVPRRGDGAARGRPHRGCCGSTSSDRLPRAGPGRAARVDRRLRPLLPAAGLLLRDVRAGRTDPQRPRPLRSDDVGADRQQRHRRGDARRLPARLGRRPPTPEQTAPLDRARRCCSASAPRSASSPSAWCCCPTCARRASPTVRASTSAAPGSGTHPPPGHLDGAVRDRQPGRVHRRGQARLRRHRRWRRGHRLHRLLAAPARDDGAALDHHRLAGHRDPAAPVVVRRTRAGSPTSAARSAPPCVRRWRWSLPFAVLLPVLVRGRGVGGLRVGRPGRRGRLRPDPRALRSGAGLLHRPLPDAARLLRRRADPARVLHPVRGLG